ncbi:MAG: pyruvate dehydrogenase (acetyl-transferring), homodimeric type, partial [Candidatus Latescibacteria bacterium]|nr:pyruvate dehydrogenase (acetyl-transferring), homodimeric type [Candidatus Latescibacterota bacterium]
ILNQALEARQLLEERFGVGTEVWSVTSFRQLHQEGMEAERWNLRHPGESARLPWLNQCLAGREGAFVVASDFLKALPDSIARWFPRPPISLGTDGFGRSESRPALRHFFEVDARTIAFAALADLARQGKVEVEVVQRVQQELEIDPDKPDPAQS